MDLHYRTYGTGHPLIVLHGLFGSLANWHTLSQRFGERYQVLAVDQRNHGASPHSDTMTYQAMAEDLRELLQAQGLNSVYLLGHSMGGKTAMQFALTYPERVDRLIVADIAPKPYSRHHDTILDALGRLDPGRFQSRAELDRALAEDLQDAGLRQFLLTNVTRDRSGRFSWKINLAAITSDYDQLIADLGTRGTFDKPVLFVRGERSDYIQPEDMALIRERFPQATLTTIPEVGHWVHAEAPKEFASAVLSFLGQ